MADPAALPVPGGPAPGRSAEPRPAGRARVTHRVAAFVVAAAACGLLAWAGVWFAPFVFGVAAGALSARGLRGTGLRGIVLPVAVGAVVGWAFPVWVLALAGQPIGATARSIAALAGIPPYAGVAVTAVLLLAALQALCGAWLALSVYRSALAFGRR